MVIEVISMAQEKIKEFVGGIEENEPAKELQKALLHW